MRCNKNSGDRQGGPQDYPSENHPKLTPRMAPVCLKALSVKGSSSSRECFWIWCLLELCRKLEGVLLLGHETTVKKVMAASFLMLPCLKPVECNEPLEQRVHAGDAVGLWRLQLMRNREAIVNGWRRVHYFHGTKGQQK